MSPTHIDNQNAKEYTNILSKSSRCFSPIPQWLPWLCPVSNNVWKRLWESIKSPWSQPKGLGAMAPGSKFLSRDVNLWHFCSTCGWRVGNRNFLYLYAGSRSRILSVPDCVQGGIGQLGPVRWMRRLCRLYDRTMFSVRLTSADLSNAVGRSS